MHASKNDGAAIEDDGREYERGFDMKGGGVAIREVMVGVNWGGV